MWTATTFRQLKGSPLRALPTTPPCRVHPCSRLFHRPPVSPSALPALPDLNSPAWPEVPAYLRTHVHLYLCTQVPRPGLGPSSSSTQLMCVYFLFATVVLFFLFILSCLTTDIIINPQFCKVQWVQEGKRAGEGPPHHRLARVSFLQRSREECITVDGTGGTKYSVGLSSPCWIPCVQLLLITLSTNIPGVHHHSPRHTASTGEPASAAAAAAQAPSLSWRCSSHRGAAVGGLELKPKPKRHRRPEENPQSPARPPQPGSALRGGRFVWYPAHERSTCHQVPSSRAAFCETKARLRCVGYQVTRLHES